MRPFIKYVAKLAIFAALLMVVGNISLFLLEENSFISFYTFEQVALLSDFIICIGFILASSRYQKQTLLSS